MSEYTLSNTASQIDSAITRVHNADTEPLPGSGNMVTSGGVKAAIDSLSQGGVTAESLGSSLDTIITSDATDSLIPTSKAVVDYITAVNVPPSARYVDSLVTYPTGGFSGYQAKNFDSVTTNFPDIFSLSSGHIRVSQAGLYSLAFQVTINVYSYGNAGYIRFRNRNHHNTLDTSLSTTRTDQQVNEDFYTSPPMGRNGTHRFAVPTLIFMPSNGEIELWGRLGGSGNSYYIKDGSFSITQVSKVSF